MVPSQVEDCPTAEERQAMQLLSVVKQAHSTIVLLLLQLKCFEVSKNIACVAQWTECGI